MELGRYERIIPDWPGFLEAASRPEPVVFRARTGRVAPAELVARLERQGFRVRELEKLPSFYRVEDGPRPLSHTLEHWSGLLYVQQASTGLAAPVLNPRPGERVLDLCASPGGKSTHLADLMQDTGCLVANDIDEKRIRALLGNAYRLCSTNMLVVAGDGRAFPEGACFDRVLVDAPCSGEGTLRRRSGEVPNQSRAFLAYVTAAQRGLLEKAVRLTRPGGSILYVTCTFAPEENEAIVSSILERAPVELDPIDLDASHSPGLTSFEGAKFDSRLEGAVRIYPHHFDSGGLFMARLRRLDGEWGVAAHDDGWSSVPRDFPGESRSAQEANDVLEHAVEDVLRRHAVTPSALGSARWILRGDTVWLHTCGEWPLASWEPASWRAVSIGLRAIEIDVRGRPRATNDLLRHVSGSVRSAVELTTERLVSLLEGSAEPSDPGAESGPVALRLDGEVLGRGSHTGGGLISHVPKTRARELARALGSHAPS